VLFSVAYKHINGTGENTLYLAQTGIYMQATCMCMFVLLREYCLCMFIEKN